MHTIFRTAIRWATVKTKSKSKSGYSGRCHSQCHTAFRVLSRSQNESWSGLKARSSHNQFRPLRMDYIDAYVPGLGRVKFQFRPGDKVPATAQFLGLDLIEQYQYILVRVMGRRNPDGTLSPPDQKQTR